MSESLVFLGREESSGGFFGKVSHQMDTLMIMGDRHGVTNPLWLKLKPDKVGGLWCWFSHQTHMLKLLFKCSYFSTSPYKVFERV